MSGHAWDGRDAETEVRRTVEYHRKQRKRLEAQVADLKARETQLLGALDDKHQDYLAALEEKRVAVEQLAELRAERDHLAARVEWLSAYVGRIEKQAEEAVAQAEELIRTCFAEPPPRRGLLDRVRDWLEEAAS